MPLRRVAVESTAAFGFRVPIRAFRPLADAGPFEPAVADSVIAGSEHPFVGVEPVLVNDCFHVVLHYPIRLTADCALLMFAVTLKTSRPSQLLTMHTTERYDPIFGVKISRVSPFLRSFSPSVMEGFFFSFRFDLSDGRSHVLMILLFMLFSERKGLAAAKAPME